MNPLEILKYQIYLLQLENYEIKRFWKLLRKKGYLKPASPLRKSLVWTNKAKLIFGASLVIWIGLILLALSFHPYWALVFAVVLFFVFPVFYTLTLLAFLPADYMAKIYFMNKAKSIVKKTKDLKIIGIAGSYGKTTMKNVIYKVLSSKIDVKMASGNINTAVGISAWICKKGLKGGQTLLIEFGEEYEGDNKKIAEIFPPDITVITGINEAHFERMGSIEKISDTIFEAVAYSQKDSKVYLNVDDPNVMNFYEKKISGREARFYGFEGSKMLDTKIKNKKFDQQNLNWSAEIGGLGEVTVPFLAEYVFADIIAAFMIAKSFGLNNDEIKEGLSKISPVEHRLQPIKGASNVLVIDDSYNGNPAGAAEAIKVLGRFTDRRKIYITPGLVESGSSNEKVHREIGRQLSKVADKVILIKNSATPFIAKGLEESSFTSDNIIWFNTATEAHDSLGQILQSNDVILFQNDWGDQHL